MARSKLVNLRVSDEEHERWSAAAEGNVSGWLRKLANTASELEPAERPVAVRIEAMTGEGIRVAPVGGDPHFKPDFK